MNKADLQNVCNKQEDALCTIEKTAKFGGMIYGQEYYMGKLRKIVDTIKDLRKDLDSKK
jgi:hypothetical protein